MLSIGPSHKLQPTFMSLLYAIMNVAEFKCLVWLEVNRENAIGVESPRRKFNQDKSENNIR